MIAAEHPLQARRLAALRELEILDTGPEREYDEIVELAARLCDAPIAVVNLIDADRQWFKAEKGLGVRSTPLDTSICSHVILEGDYVEIGDTLRDLRMSDNPLCVGADGLRFYAGAVLRSEEGLPVGTLCVLDRKPRHLDPFQRDAIEVLGRQVMRLLDLRLSLKRQELLAQEVDHRVKNSLASVGAIVRLQAMRSDDSNVRAALDEVSARLAAITAVHEELQQIREKTAIDLALFLERLLRHLRLLLADGMRLDAEVEPIEVPSDAIGAVGLIVNEFVSNCAKHGRPEADHNAICIRGRYDKRHYLLECIHDGGADRAVLAAINASRGLGTRIIQASADAIGSQAEWRLDSGRLVLGLRLPLRIGGSGLASNRQPA